VSVNTIDVHSSANTMSEMTSSSAVAGRDIEAWQGTHFFHPWIDFLCLGGASLVVLPVILLLPSSATGYIAVVALLLATVINYPHFAHSYQIFYSNYRQKAFGPDTDRILRYRYIFAGIVVPVGLILFFGMGIVQSDARMVGFGANLMLFLVGWHYVKQGYGMMIVDSVLKKCFFQDSEKKIFLINSYVCWIFIWAIINNWAGKSEYWGIQYYTFAVPEEVVFALGAMVVISTGCVLWTLFNAWKDRGSLPVNGVMAYFVSIYFWLFLRVDPAALLAIPAFHSLQYLLVVWRYELNRNKAVASAEFAENSKKQVRRITIGLTAFLVIGVSLGYLGFWGLPIFLQTYAEYDRAIFGGSLFFFLFSIFINVHHYCLDNVMWRRENPETRKYLFGHMQS
jgi:hypothetical protein